MSFKTLVIPSETFKVSDSVSITVRGLDLADMLFLLRTHGAPLQDLYARAISTDGGLNAADINELAMAMLDESPILVGCIIACGAGEPDEFSKAANLPGPLQLQMLEAIAKMTFALEGGLGKFMETIGRMIQGLANHASPSD